MVRMSRKASTVVVVVVVKSGGDVRCENGGMIRYENCSSKQKVEKCEYSFVHACIQFN